MPLSPGLFFGQDACLLPVWLVRVPDSLTGFTGSVAHARSGAGSSSRPGRNRSSRNRRISSGTCIRPGDCGCPVDAGAAPRMRRCEGGKIRRRFPECRVRIAVCLLAFVHRSYYGCTIITHMRINHLKDRTMTQAFGRSPGVHTAVRFRSTYNAIPAASPAIPMSHAVGERNTARPAQVRRPIAGTKEGYRRCSEGNRRAAMFAMP